MLYEPVEFWNMYTALTAVVFAAAFIGVGYQWGRERYLQKIEDLKFQLREAREDAQWEHNANIKQEAIEIGLRRELVEARTELKAWRDIGPPITTPPRGGTPTLVE